MMFLDCPAYLDQDGTVRCGLPAEVRRRSIMGSSGGPLECAMIRCPVGHWFNGPIEFLTWDGKHQPGLGTAAAAPPARPASPHDSRSETLYLRDLTPANRLAVGRMPEFVAETYTLRGAAPGRTYRAAGRARSMDQYLDLLGMPSGGALRASVGLAEGLRGHGGR